MKTDCKFGFAEPPG